MFAVGDKVVYPMHGAGVVKTIEKRERDGQSVDYLILAMLLGDEGHGSGRQCGTCWLEACYRK